MRKGRSVRSEVLVFLAVFSLLYSPGSVTASISCDSRPYNFSKAENCYPDSIDGLLKSNTIELGNSTLTGFFHDLHLAGGGHGASRSKGGLKGSGRGYVYEGSKGSDSYKGSQRKTGGKDLKGAPDSKGEKDEFQEKQEKDIKAVCNTLLLLGR